MSVSATKGFHSFKCVKMRLLAKFHAYSLEELTAICVPFSDYLTGYYRAKEEK